MAYDIKNLLNYSSSPYTREYKTKEQVICDIDKTYLETQTSSFLDLAKTALEKPEDKKTILGAGHYLEALLWSHNKNEEQHEALAPLPKNLHFVSASPPQLKSKLEEKFLLDRLCWTSMTLKNQFYNIKKIKFHLLREQISYKTLAIFNLIDKNPSTTFFFIGDNSESDPYIYTGIKLLKDGSLSHKGYVEFLKIAGLTKSSIRTIVQTKGFFRQSKIRNIFIRDIKPQKTSSLDHYLVKFSSYKELFFKSYEMGYISKEIFSLFIKSLYESLKLNHESLSQTLQKELVNHGFKEEEAKNFTLRFILKKVPISRTNKIPKKKPEESKFLDDAQLWFTET